MVRLQIIIKLYQMAMKTLLLVCLYCSRLHYIRYVAAQMITQPPESTTVALGTNTTFYCRGIGSVLWQINGTQVLDAVQVQIFVSTQVFVPPPRDNFSELIVTATEKTNATLAIMCIVNPFRGVEATMESDPVRLFVYAEPNPPVDLNLTVDGLSLVAKWNEPFSLEGEMLSYVIFITNNASGKQDKFNTNTTTYVLSKPIEERNCAEYMFTVFSNNSYSMSTTNISGYGSIPTVPVVIRRPDVWINVSLIEDIQIIISFNPTDPCPTYPVISYTLNISEDSGNFTTTLKHTGSTSVNINGSGLGLLHDQVYQLTIEATNTIGSTSSEKIQFYTTGLQSSFAVVELNGSITVTCTFATGALTTGCQVTILRRDSLREVFSRSITRPDGVSQVTENMLVPGVSENNALLLRAAELLSGGGVGNTLFERVVMVASLPTAPTTTLVSVIIPTVQSTPISFGSTFYFIIGVVGGVLVVLLLLIFVSVCVTLSLKNKRSERNHSLFTADERVVEMKMNEVNRDGIETKPNEVYGVSTDDNETTPNVVYGVSTDDIETTPNVVYGVSTDDIETTPNVVYGVSTDDIETTPNVVYGVSTDGIETTHNEAYGDGGCLQFQSHAYEVVKL